MEEIVKCFCRAYLEVFHKAEHLIHDRNQVAFGDVRRFTQDMFHRLMFLRLVECRDCMRLNGRTDYLRALHQAGSLGSHSFYRSRIRPLLQAAETGEQPSVTEIAGQIPSFAGCQFPPLRNADEVFDAPDAVFDLLFGGHAVSGIFYRYPFTADESADGDVDAITPEILGTLFEQMAIGREQSGVYYTDRRTVARMCRKALRGHLARDGIASEEIIAALVDRHDASAIEQQDTHRIIDALASLKAVDPACGCGAYLLGMLHELVAIYQALYAKSPLDSFPTRYTLKRRIISQNLYGADIDPNATAITGLRFWLSLATELSQPMRLPAPDFNIATGDSLLGPDPRDVTISAQQMSVSRAGSVEHDTRDGVIDWRATFPDVFARPTSGFDIVLANPPYVDAHTMVKRMPEYRAALARQYETAQGTWDLYIPFWERAIQLLNRHGIATLITPNKWFSTGYGKRLRVIARPMLWQIDNYTDFRAFRNIGVASVVVSLKRLGSDTIDIKHYSSQQTVVHQSRILPEQAASLSKWGVLLSPHLDLLVKLIQSNTTLGEVCSVEEACAVSQAYKLAPYIHELDNDKQQVFKFVNTGTIDPYVSLWGTKPTTYLKTRYQRPVVSRSVLRDHFPARYKQMVDTKLILSGMRHFEAFFDPHGEWAAGISTVILRQFRPPYSALFLLGLLNSHLIGFFMKECYGSLGIDRGVNFSRLNVSEIPVPTPLSAAKPVASEIARIAQHIVSIKATDPNASIESSRRRIDTLVYRLFGLSQQEAVFIAET